MHALPMFDLEDAAGVVKEINDARKAHPETYIRVIAYDAARHRQSVAMLFIVQRPTTEPGFRLERTETNDRHIQYKMHSYAADRPAGDRYQAK
jgi:ribulose-bisphosphate carboxylase small chain